MPRIVRRCQSAILPMRASRLGRSRPSARCGHTCTNEIYRHLDAGAQQAEFLLGPFRAVLLARRCHRGQIVTEEELVVDIVEDAAAILERLADASGDVARQVPDGKEEAAVRRSVAFQPPNRAVEVVEAKLLFRGQG
jgi:hypothetical protein